MVKYQLTVDIQPNIHKLCINRLFVISWKILHIYDSEKDMLSLGQGEER